MVKQQRVEDLPVCFDRTAKAGATVFYPPTQEENPQMPPATKANVMISWNGLILTVLTLSGPRVLVAEPMFTLPIAAFLVGLTSSAVGLMMVGMVYDINDLPEILAAVQSTASPFQPLP